MRRLFDFTKSYFCSNNFIFVADFKEIFVYNVENFLFQNHFIPRVNNLKYFSPNSISYLKKGLYIKSDESCAYFSIKLKKIFFYSSMNRKIGTKEIFKKRNLMKFFLLEKNIIYLFDFELLIKFIKTSYFKKFYYQIKIDSINLYLNIGSWFKCCKFKGFLLKKILNNFKDNLIKLPLFSNFSKNIVTIWETDSNRIILKFFQNTMYGIKYFPLKTKTVISSRLSNEEIKILFGANNVKSWLVSSECHLITNSFIHLRKQFLNIYFFKKIKIIKFTSFLFKFIFLEKSKDGIGIWKKSFQENWSTIDPEFNQTNISKVKELKTLLFFL